MLDALWPAAEALASAVETGQNQALALATAVRAAKEGAQATRHIVARWGRSSYLGDLALGHPDPGAFAVGVWLEACEG
jgi:dihydroxyacetone kinase